MKEIELLDPDDVADDLRNYLETVERAEELAHALAEVVDDVPERVDPGVAHRFVPRVGS